jgi:succinate dehydrogenase/fumarate reductase cytochrome b subunit
MDSLFKSLGVVGIILLVVFVLCIGPMVFLWSVNSLAELGGAKFYIEHSLWTYFVSLVFLSVMKASASSSKD